MKKILFCLMIFLLFSCQKEKISDSGNASEVFYVQNNGASMRVFVKGNTSNNIFILVIHGGPGVSSYFYDTSYISRNLGDKYAMVYWDQRNAGASQGASNGNKLHLGQMTQDLKKVIQILKYRYGENMSLFLVGHSFGGLITSAFITDPDNEKMIKGLINVDGSHNYPLNDTLTRQMLLSYGLKQISLRQQEKEWKDIVNYCNSHPGNFTLEESQKLESYASEAENLIDSVNSVGIFSQLLENSIRNKFPITAILSNLIYTEDSGVNTELAVSSFSSTLKNVTIPVLVLWGKYDFTCPQALGRDFYNRISSVEKRFVISPVSGHNMMVQDEELFCNEVSDFVQKYR